MKDTNLYEGLLTVNEAAKLLNRTRRMIDYYIASGKLEAVKILGKQYIKAEQVLSMFPKLADK